MRRALLLLLALTGCSKDLLAPLDGGGTGDGVIDADKRVFESTEVTTNDGLIVIERVSYRSSGGLLIVGQVCRPAGPGPFPVYVFNHGGFAGLPDWNGGTCADTALGGSVLAESSYRGEDGSEGEIEVCGGEVDDVLRLIDLVLAQPYADPADILMFGPDHGGCVTVRVAERGAPVKAAVDLFGATDWASLHAFWRAGIDSGSPSAAVYQSLLTTLETAAGGTPAEVPEAYAARSPRASAADLGAFSGAVLVAHGTNDTIIPALQSCVLAADASGFEAYHLDDIQAESAAPPAGCEAADVTWIAAPRPRPAWPGRRYLVVYDGTDAALQGAGGAILVDDMVTFLQAKKP